MVIAHTESTAVTGALALYETLRACGVTHLFGLDSPEPLYAEVDRTEIRPITIRDERSGAIMADAFARVSGRPGVCTAYRGPGVTNLISGIAEAWAASIPVVAVVNDTRPGQLGKNPLQEVDQIGLFRPVTKWQLRIDRPQRIAELTARAFTIATSGRPGPVVLHYPDDPLEATGADAPQTSVGPIRYPSSRTGPDPAMVAQAVAALAGAKRPAILVGGGVHLSGAWAELREVAELLGAPVGTTPLGKGAFDETHPLSLGVVGAYTGGKLGRGRFANEVIRTADLILLVGTRMDSNTTAGWTLPPPGSRTIHLDIDPAEIGRNYPSLGLLGDAKLGLAALAEGLRAVGARPASDRKPDIERATNEWRAKVAPLLASNAKPIRPERIVGELLRYVDDNTILCTDASYSSVWVMDMISLRRPGRRFLAPRGFAGIGWGLPAAIGAKLAAPSQRVLCLTGDGGFGYVFHELETAARYNVPIVVVVLNNRCFGFQKHFEQANWGRSFETDILDVDHGALARALHCEGVRVTDPNELGPALAQAVATNRPTVIDVVIDPDVLPPLLMFETAAAQAAKATH